MEERHEDGHEATSLSEDSANLNRVNVYGVSGRHRPAASPALCSTTAVMASAPEVYVISPKKEERLDALN